MKDSIGTAIAPRQSDIESNDAPKPPDAAASTSNAAPGPSGLHEAAFAAQEAAHYGLGAADIGLAKATEAVEHVRGARGGAMEAGLVAVAKAAETAGAKLEAGAEATYGVLDAKQMLAPVVRSQGADVGSFDASKEPVVLRIEIATSTEGKVLRFVNWFMGIGAFGATLGLAVKHRVQVEQSLMQDYLIAATIVNSVALALVVALIGLFISRFLKVRRHHQAWSRRRAVVSVTAFAILLFVTLSVAFTLTGTALLLPEACGSRLRAAIVFGYLQWSMWNLVFATCLIITHNNSFWRGPMEKTSTCPLMMDAPQHAAHMFAILFWTPFQVFLSLLLWINLRDLPAGCDLSQKECPGGDLKTVFLGLAMASICAYGIAFFFLSWRANKDLVLRSYVEMRFVRMIAGLQRQIFTPIFLSLSFSIVVVFGALLDACSRTLAGWLGYPTFQILGVCVAGSLSFFSQPKIPGSKDEVLQAWLQEFAWTERAMPSALAQRNAHLASSEQLAKEAMFCMETAIKLFYFSWLAYRCKDSKGTPADLETGGVPGSSRLVVTPKENCSPANMTTEDLEGDVHPQLEGDIAVIGPNVSDALGLYGLTDWDIIIEPATDTKAILAWGNGTIVLAFRGTFSATNARTDLKFLTVMHPPQRWHAFSTVWGLRLLKTFVRVHGGFFAAWTAHGFSTRVLQKMREIMAQMDGTPRILITGHSLGGALATLAAIDIQRQFQVPPTVYTYGQPRVGNRAFALDYNELVPDHFSVIHDQDPVTRIPAGMRYKRSGKRTRINLQGDIMVSPTFMEMQISNRRGEFSEMLCMHRAARFVFH
jgi:hypothetical protein